MSGFELFCEGADVFETVASQRIVKITH
jgi:hypothetical protein